MLGFPSQEMFLWEFKNFVKMLWEHHARTLSVPSHLVASRVSVRDEGCDDLDTTCSRGLGENCLKQHTHFSKQNFSGN